MISYYRHGGGYIVATDQSPAGFEGLVFVGRGGPLDNIQEQLFAVGVLTDPVNVNDVPAEWVTALGYHTVEDFPLLDEAGENLVAEIPVRESVQPAERPVEPVVSLARQLFGDKNIAFQVGLLIGLILAIWYLL